MIVALALALLAGALWVLWLANRQQRAAGLPPGRVIYRDTSRWRATEKPLYDPISGLAGKPDYLVEEHGRLIPIEVKSSRAPALPHDSHIYQLAAYCLLVARTRGQRPPYGILHYRDKTFAIAYTPALERELEALMAEMRQCERRGAAERSHRQPARCARCGFRTICDQRL